MVQRIQKSMLSIKYLNCFLILNPLICTSTVVGVTAVWRKAESAGAACGVALAEGTVETGT